MLRSLVIALLFTCLAVTAAAVEPSAVQVVITVDAAALATLNNHTALPPLWLQLDDATHANTVRFDLGAALRVNGEQFAPDSGDYVGGKAFYRSVPATFALPAGFVPDRSSVYAQDGSEQIPVSYQLTLPGTTQHQASSVLDGDSSLVTIEQNGPMANRLAFVLVGDGYTTADRTKWQNDAHNIFELFFAQSPWKEYRSYFNFYRLDAFSLESGADHPSTGISKNTAFDASYGCGGTERLICASSDKVQAEVDKHLSGTAHELIVLVVNDPEYGGSGGTIPVISTDVNAVEIALHEVGHSFANLTDEYVDTQYLSPDKCQPTVEPTAANASILHTQSSQVKWGYWIAATTAVPTTTTSTTSSEPGLYAGSQYCDNLYRPTPNSKMRTLLRPYDAINEEQFVLRYYDYVTLLDGISPTNDKLIDLSQGTVTSFSFQAQNPKPGGVTGDWYLDGVKVASATSLNAAAIPFGTHALELIVTDPTPKVRKDTQNKLSSQTQWSVVRSTEVADFTSGNLVIPVVRLNTGVAYRATLHQDTGVTTAMEFVVDTLQASNAVPQNSDAAYVNGVLTIPQVTYNQQNWQVEMQVVAGTPMRLRVTKAKLVQ
ncbi:MAG TPA: M64 family metallopeptidase [Candidatus Acidoferrum sp.]|nr:M64 family metallopeptidase [Candidatus Acidoferrum sp.]